jgi:hypothetical protein
MSVDIPNTDIDIVYKNLKDSSTAFNGYVGSSPYTDIFNFFVNIDAFKDNKSAFKNGGNHYFTSSNEGIQLASSLKAFKVMMRTTIQDLQKIGMSHLLHIHKLKYRSSGKLPPPAILQYLPDGLVVHACFDSGSGPSAVFGDRTFHEKSMNYIILCSVANTVIDPGPSGSTCGIHIETGFTGFPGFRPTLDSAFFTKFGYSNIQEFRDTGASTFELLMSSEFPSPKPVEITHKSTPYLAGNADNSKYFNQPASKKDECDIRTTMKKLGDDLQVFISCLYKIKLIDAGISTILVMMLTCDLGVSFMSLMLGLDCVFKDKDEEQQDPGQQKLGNSWYIKSLLGAPEPNFEEEIQKTRAYVISEYEDFMLLIGEIISKLQPTYVGDITIQIKGDTAYNKQQLVDTKTFFETIYSDLYRISAVIATMPVAQNSTSIDELKKCVPNKFILRHRLDQNIYAFTMAQKYTRGDNIPHELNNGTTGKTKATPFVQQFKTLTRRILAIKRGGGKAVPMGDFFIDSPVLVVYTPYDADKEVADDRRQYIGNVAVELFNQKNSNTFLVLNKIAGYVQDDFYYNGLSYVDDALDGYADYEQIPNYVDEFIGMINTWMQEEMQKGISVPISMNTGLKRGTDYDTNLDYDRELGKENKLSRIGVFGGKKNKKTLTKQTKKKRNYPKNVRKNSKTIKKKNNKTQKNKSNK